MGPVSLGANRSIVESHICLAVNSDAEFHVSNHRRLRPLGRRLSSLRKAAIALSASACLSALR